MPLRTDDNVYRPSARITGKVSRDGRGNNSPDRRVYSSEVDLDIVASVRNWVVRTIRKPKVGLALGLGFAALAGAPMPLPQLSLIGPWLAACAAGVWGARSAAMLGLVSFILLAHPGFIAASAATAIALLLAWGMPKWVTAAPPREVSADQGASAVAIDCEGFGALDERYGNGAGDHVFRLLRKALEVETRNTDLVVHVQGQELILVLDGSSPIVAQRVMERVEQRFSAWLDNAGYECNLSVGLADMDRSEDGFDSLLRATRRFHGKPYLD